MALAPAASAVVPAAPLDPDVTFIVIAYNERANIVRTVAAILAQRTPLAYDVLVVDDGSADGTAEEVEAAFADDPRVAVHRCGVNRGRGAARDEGVRRARGRAVAFVDADITLPPDWLERCWSALDGVAAVGGTAVPDGDVAYLHRRFGLAPKVVHHSAVVTGSNGLYRREVFDVAGFDPTKRNGEDVAFNEDLARAGLVGRTVPDLLVEHQESKSFGQSVRWLFESGVGAGRQFTRTRRVRTPDLTFFGMCAVAAAALVAPRRLRPVAVGALATYPLAVAAAHTATRFDLARTPASAAPAVAADYVLICAYFAGRAAAALP